MGNDNLDDFLSIRISREDKEAFKNKCEDMNRKPGDLHRELIAAFMEGRVIIKPTDEQLKQQEMYLNE